MLYVIEKGGAHLPVNVCTLKEKRLWQKEAVQTRRF